MLNICMLRRSKVAKSIFHTLWLPERVVRSARKKMNDDSCFLDKPKTCKNSVRSLRIKPVMKPALLAATSLFRIWSLLRLPSDSRGNAAAPDAAHPEA